MGAQPPRDQNLLFSRGFQDPMKGCWTPLCKNSWIRPSATQKSIMGRGVNRVKRGGGIRRFSLFQASNQFWGPWEKKLRTPPLWQIFVYCYRTAVGLTIFKIVHVCYYELVTVKFLNIYVHINLIVF